MGFCLISTYCSNPLPLRAKGLKAKQRRQPALDYGGHRHRRIHPQNAWQRGTAAGRWNHQARRVKVGWNYNRFANRPTFRVGWRWRNKPRHFTLF
ncbi:hypothetical protein [Streptomyces cyaneofuscatus]|uniref:hypothetical protein n=1 Tax=Streptomyces griseus group TaxID=629295 RepID=UPI0037A40750